jgi:hypothetical protein
MLRKKEGRIDPNTAQRTIGVLKAYYENDLTNTGSFIVDGYSPRQFATTRRDIVDVYILVEEN